MNWLGFATAVGIITSFFGLWWVLHSALHRVRCARHIAARNALSDEEFTGMISVDHTLRALCLAIRRAMGKLAGVPPETIYPSDSMIYLNRLTFNWTRLQSTAFDYGTFWEHLQKEFGHQIDEDATEKAIPDVYSNVPASSDPKTFSDFILFISSAARFRTAHPDSTEIGS